MKTLFDLIETAKQEATLKQMEGEAFDAYCKSIEITTVDRINELFKKYKDYLVKSPGDLIPNTFEAIKVLDLIHQELTQNINITLE